MSTIYLSSSALIWEESQKGSRHAPVPWRGWFCLLARSLAPQNFEPVVGRHLHGIFKTEISYINPLMIAFIALLGMGTLIFYLMFGIFKQHACVVVVTFSSLHFILY
jgi:hypothetical protein